MGKYNNSLTRDDILRIAKTRGSFSTTPRYRDDKVRGKCRQLVNEGKLKISPDCHKFNNQEFLYVKPTESPTHE